MMALLVGTGQVGDWPGQYHNQRLRFVHTTTIG
jgi:hypothetical protein